MRNNHPNSPVRKTIPALVAALTMTVFIGVMILAFGLSALFNPNGTVALAAGQSDSQLTVDQATVQEWQDTISQYQTREAQYQEQLQQAADQINQLGQQNLQYQQLIQALQNAGVIQITRDGRVFLSRGAGFSSGFGDDGN